jgi:hypothetical protein
MLPQVSDQRLDVVGGHLQVGLVNELSPPEAVGAVRVAGLPLTGKEQDRFRVLVLQARQRSSVQAGRVQYELSGWVRVQPHPYLVRPGGDLLPRRPRGDEPRQVMDILGGQHVRLRKHQPVYGIVGRGGPIDKFFDHVAIGPERQDRSDGADRQAIGLAEAGPFGQRVQVFCRVGAESSSGLMLLLGYHLLNLGQASSPSVRLPG